MYQYTVAKARGVKLGNPNIDKARAMRKAGIDMSMATSVRQHNARNRAIKVMRAITVHLKEEVTSLQQIVKYLNDHTSIRTSRDCVWTRVAVARVLRQAGTDLESLKQSQSIDGLP